MKDLTKVLFWYGPVELARGLFKKLNGPLDHLIFFMQRTIQDFKKLNGPLDHLIFFMQRTIQDFHVKNNFIDIFK